MKVYMFGVVTGGFSLRKRNQLRGFGKGIKCSLKVQQQQPPPPIKSSLFEISIPGQEEEEEEEEGLTLVFLGDQGVGKTSIITSCTVTSTTVIRLLFVDRDGPGFLWRYDEAQGRMEKMRVGFEVRRSSKIQFSPFGILVNLSRRRRVIRRDVSSS
ncbi:hypothetical protein YC2023_065523 [Brassica napus]